LLTYLKKTHTIYYMEQQDYFEGLIAQDDIKETLTGFIDIYKDCSVLPHIFLTAPRGCGKTVFARKVGENLGKKFIEVNAGSIKNVKEFFHNIIIPHIQNQDATLFLDEAHKLPKCVENCLLTILQEGKDNTSEFEFEEYTYEFDFTRISVIAATTEPQNVFHALKDRFELVELDDYTVEDLGEILEAICEDITFKDNVLSEIAPVLRGNARAASKLGKNINRWMNTYSDSISLGKEEWAAIKKWKKIKPLGLGKKELLILELLGERKEARVTSIAATLLLTRQAVMEEEQYLQKQHLMEIKNSVRCITREGQQYLEALENVESIEPVKPAEPVPPAPKPKEIVRLELPKPNEAIEPVVSHIPEDMFQMMRNAGR